jgi:hypothetical protein
MAGSPREVLGTQLRARRPGTSKVVISLVVRRSAFCERHAAIAIPRSSLEEHRAADCVFGNLRGASDEPPIHYSLVKGRAARRLLTAVNGNNNVVRDLKSIFVPSKGPDSSRDFLAEPETQWAPNWSARTLAYCWKPRTGSLAKSTQRYLRYLSSQTRGRTSSSLNGRSRYQAGRVPHRTTSGFWRADSRGSSPWRWRGRSTSRSM